MSGYEIDQKLKRALVPVSEASAPWLSVVIPAYNEESNLKRGVLDNVWNYFSTQSYSFEVVLVNDGSCDHTLWQLKQFARGKSKVFVLDIPHAGKASAIMEGIRAATGDFVLFTDMDLATPIEEFDFFAPHLESCDLVIGTRLGRDGAPWVRQLMSWGMQALRWMVLRLPFHDTQCGFKAMRRSAVLPIIEAMLSRNHYKVSDGPAVNAGFDLELLYQAVHHRLRVRETLVRWHYCQSRRVQFVRDTYRSLREVFEIRRRRY
jgi:glycosyltransferase involved in cell wall biosynthesis